MTEYQKACAQVAQESACWQETAKQHLRNQEYYRGLIVRIGAVFGVAAKTQDDGGVVEDVLCAKVPELVEALAQKVADLERERSALVKDIEEWRRSGESMSKLVENQRVHADKMAQGVERLKGELEHQKDLTAEFTRVSAQQAMIQRDENQRLRTVLQTLCEGMRRFAQNNLIGKDTRALLERVDFLDATLATPEQPMSHAVSKAMDKFWKRYHELNAKVPPEQPSTTEVNDGMDLVPGDRCASSMALVEVHKHEDLATPTADRMLDCQKCKGTGSIDGHHKPGYIHYETDAGEPCPPYHFESVKCDQCNGHGKIAAMMREEK